MIFNETVVNNPIVDVSARPIRIAMIDDNDVEHFIVKMMTRSLNNVVIQPFFHAEDVLQNVSSGGFEADYILLDLDMPVMDGWQFLEEFDKLTASYPVYIVSSSRTQHDIDRAKQFACVRGFFLKPLTLSSILRIIC